MRLSYIFNSVSLVLKHIAIAMLAPCIVALYYKDYYSLIPFIVASFTAYFIGHIFSYKKIDDEELNNIKKSEALFVVALSWTFFGIIAAIPYLFYNLSFLDSLFEGVSGITTTGATILTDFSLYPKTMFFWRSLSQWLGGMGIIVLFIAILPQFAVAGRQMFFAEAPGPTEDKFTPRIKYTATALWKIYTVITLIEIIILKLCGMPFFDAACNSFSSLAGGGFSPNPQSIMGYNNNIYVWVISIFMFIAAMNFPLIYKLVTKRKMRDIIQDQEFMTYFGIVLFFIISITISLLVNNFGTFTDALRNSVFQVTSIISTSGFVSFDFNQWPLSSKMFLFAIMFIGGCAGSAAGGLKIIRIIFIFKYIRREISKIHHPCAVYPIKINKTVIPKEVVQQMIAFIVFYYLTFALTSFIAIIIEQNIVTGVTGAITTLGNIGPGFGNLGPMNSFAHLHPFTKIMFTGNMLIGRLELIPFLAMLHPDFWRLKN